MSYNKSNDENYSCESCTYWGPVDWSRDDGSLMYACFFSDHLTEDEIDDDMPCMHKYDDKENIELSYDEESSETWFEDELEGGEA